eukprot:6312476-Amphidinium_carterae.1
MAAAPIHDKVCTSLTCFFIPFAVKKTSGLAEAQVWPRLFFESEKMALQSYPLKTCLAWLTAGHTTPSLRQLHCPGQQHLRYKASIEKACARLQHNILWQHLRCKTQLRSQRNLR